MWQQIWDTAMSLITSSGKISVYSQGSESGSTDLCRTLWKSGKMLLQGDEWDSVMNYDAFMEPVTWFLTGMENTVMNIERIFMETV